MTDLFDVMTLMDPELSLPTDAPAFRSVGRIVAVGSWTAEYPDFRSLMADRAQRELDLHTAVTPEQAKIAPPAYIRRDLVLPDGPLTIYAQMFTPDHAYEQERATGAGHAEAAKLRERVRNAMERGWLWGRFYSTVEPDGELGCIHRAEVETTITADEFLDAQQAGWP
jgi:hypothetical protein